MALIPGRAPRPILLLSALLLTFGGAGAAQAAEAPSGGGYAALGDSYSSGLGAGDYRAGASCGRSTRAYPELWAAAHRARQFAFTACSGATTQDVVKTQLGPLNKETRLVSITVGANDAGFADVMSACVLSSDSSCRNKVAAARAYIANELPRALDATYGAIRKKAPKALVVVLGYPHLFAPHGTCALGMSEAKQTTINDGVDVINRVMSQRATHHGFTFGDVTKRFTGHGICSAASWIHPVTFPVNESFHPTGEGQEQGYLPVLTALARL